MTKIVSKAFNVHNARQFIESLTEPASDNYYLTFGKHTQYANSDTVVPTPLDSQSAGLFDIYNDMIFGKKINGQDTAHVINKNLWTSGTVYDMFDDNDNQLYIKNFYVAVLSGAVYNVYKCLFNNNGGISTASPSVISTTPSTYVDGYVWQYLYTIDSASWTKFTTTSYMPAGANTAVTSAAKDRDIAVIVTEAEGAGYDNYLSGAFETDTQIISTTTFRLQGSASPFNDFYTGCIIEFTTDIGKEYKEIVNYTVVGAARTIEIDTPIENTVTIGDSYIIYPRARVYGDGYETDTCLAWAIIDSAASNSISRIEVIRSGAGYRSATAKVIADESVAVDEEASIRPIVSPINGHGYSPIDELFGNKVCISVKVSNTESNNIIANNDFRNITVIKNPMFDTIKLEHANTEFIFNTGELVYQYVPIQLTGTASIDATTNGQIITGNTTQFGDSFSINDLVLLKTANSIFLSTITSVTSNTALAVSNTAADDITNANVYLVKTNSSGIVTSYQTTAVNITAVSNNFYTGSYVIGTESRTAITLTGVKNNERNTNNLNTFQQTVKFAGTITGTFINDEVVYQQGVYADENLRPTGRIFHYMDDTADYLYITNERNQFSSDGVIIGNTSGATFACINKYNGDLIKDSGQVLFLDNVSPITRSSTTSETVKFTLEF